MTATTGRCWRVTKALFYGTDQTIPTQAACLIKHSIYEHVVCCVQFDLSDQSFLYVLVSPVHCTLASAG